MTLSQAFQLAVQHHQAGRLAEAEAIYRQILTVAPQHAEALHLLGLIAHQRGRSDLAVEMMEQARAFLPNDPALQANLGAAYQELGRADEAIAACQKALQIQPDLPDACNSMGMALMSKGRIEEAIVAYQRAIQARPDYAPARLNLGSALAELGRTDEAIEECHRAVQLVPNSATAHYNLGHALMAKGQFVEAIAACLRAVGLQPAFAPAYSNLGRALKGNGQLDEAIAAYRQALALQPDLALVHSNLGSALQAKGQLDEAIAACRRAIALQPKLPEAHNNLGHALRAKGQLEQGIVAFRRALELDPTLSLAHSNLGNALMWQGRTDEAMACYHRAIDLPPHSASLHSNLLVGLQYCSSTTLPVLLDAHREYDCRHAAPLRAFWKPHLNTRDADRPLRLGFVSPHFASHPVGQFLIRCLENLNPRGFQIVCYSDTANPDEMTARLRATAAEWHEVTGVPDDTLAQRIRGDAIDILFDLAGQTAGNRLLVFARKPAPIQITWLDYVGTTGLSAMDYLLADPHEIPPESERWYSEKVLRMPDDYICFDPPAAPVVGSLPALTKGHVSFGSFNIPQKTTPEIVAIWAQILGAVPGARLVIKNRGFDEASTRVRYQEMFTAKGIATDRVALFGWSPAREVLACYNEVDIALDTFPYNGGLTTCEALWMGVPVVTCPGETFASRHGLTHLTAARFTETIASSLDEYVELAVTLAGDLPRLAALRMGLRERVAASPLCDGKSFAGNFGTLIRDVWRRWCVQAG